MSKFTDTQKLEAVKKVLDNGRRGSEWQEAGLLHAVDAIVDEEVADLSSETIQKLIDDASNF